MRRREFLALLGGAAVVRSLAARAQEAPPPVIGFLNGGAAWESAALTSAFLKGLGETGFIGASVSIEYRWAEGHYDRLPALAADLVRRQVNVIAATGGPAQVLAAKAATRTIPITFQVGADPVELGLVASLNRPGGNLTGATSMNLEAEPKQIEIMHELAPAAPRIALLVNPNNTNSEAEVRTAQTAIRTLGLQLQVLNASAERDFDGVFANLLRQRAGGLVIGPDPFLRSNMEQLAEMSLRHAVPSISPYREFAAAGGLMSYGGDLGESWKQAGIYTGRILKGEKPADLPVQRSRKIELTINTKTAKAMNLSFPHALIERADEVIE